MQIDLRCEKCKSELKSKQVRKGTLVCTCPTCNYKFSMKIDASDEMEIGF